MSATRSMWWWPALVLVLAIAAFFPTYFGRFPAFENTSAVVHFHVATVVAWLALGVAQPILVARGRVALHRTLGHAVYVLLPIIAVGFALVMREGQLRHGNAGLVVATAFDASMFFFLVGMGLLYRRRRAYHARFMMLSLVPFLNPTLGRLIAPQVSVPIELAVLVLLWVRARRRRDETRPFAIALAMFVGALAAVVVAMVTIA